MDKEIMKLQELVDRITTQNSNTLDILEAGCGSITHISFGRKAHVTGIDISEAQLSRNQYIHEKILGDIQLYDFQPSCFDIIVCWNVLEHLQNPISALSRFVSALKQGGFIILGLPNGLSLKGFLAKYTPHSFHIWVYKNIYGIDNAGKDDNAPFKTILSNSIFPYAIKQFALRNHLNIIYFASYDPEFYTKGLGVIFVYIKKLVKFLSFGRIGDSDLIVLLQKT